MPVSPGPPRDAAPGATSGEQPAVPAPLPGHSAPPGPEAVPERPPAGGAVGFRGARSELRRQLREQKRVRTMAMAVVVVMLLGAPMLYFGILFATRDPVLNSLDRLAVPDWAAQAPEDRIISGSRWCFIDCRLRERTLESLREPGETTAIYQSALLAAGWVRWDVPGCPAFEVDGDYSCWTRDEYTLDLWVRPPECAYDPLNLRPDVTEDDPDGDDPDGDDPDGDDPDGDDPDGTAGPEGCSGSVVEIKMQNRVADERGLPGAGDGFPQDGLPDGGATQGPESGDGEEPGTDPDPESTASPDPADAG